MNNEQASENIYTYDTDFTYDTYDNTDYNFFLFHYLFFL